MHHYLGCDPCLPGDLYAEYMKKKQIVTCENRARLTVNRQAIPTKSAQAD